MVAHHKARARPRTGYRYHDTLSGPLKVGETCRKVETSEQSADRWRA
jgi:hypothetical protein